MQIVKKILNGLLTFLIVVVLIVSIFVAVMSLTSKENGISTFFGYTVQVIQSDSMSGGSDEYPGGDFEKGDVIIGKATAFDDTRTYSVGDIVTYRGLLKGYEELGAQLICHRIVDTYNFEGEISYQTQGDNRDISQVPDQTSVTQYIHSYDIGAYFHTSNYDGIVIKGVGKFYDFINSQLGFFLCILLPMIIFFLIVLIKFVINVINYKNAVDEEKKEKQTPQTSDAPAIPQMDAEQYEQFQQFLAFQNAQKSAQQTPEQMTEQPVEQPVEQDTEQPEQ